MKTILKKLLLLLLLLPIAALSQDVLTGNVLDGNNSKPLPGVNVNIKNSPGGVSTDFDGSFKITNIKAGDVVVFSYIGYKSEILTYSGQKNVKIYLTEEQNSLKEVVVQVGYGSVKKKDATGSVTTLNSKDFNKGPVVSVDQLLTGKAAGVRITSAGGSPDSAPNIRIRGGASISADNNPLIIIDGVAIGNENPAGVNNPLTLVNPNDVESFSILKDASATAIYGVRASNGVIIITTKKGTNGEPQYNFSSNFSIGRVDKKVNVFNGSDYVSFIQNYFPTRVNDLGIDDPNTNVVDNPSTPQVEGRIISNTNWQDEIFRTSISSDYNFSARANLYKKIPFRVSIGYNKTQGLIKTNDYERFNYSLKLTPKLLNDNLKIDVNAKGTLTDKNAIDEGGAIGGAIAMDPTKPVFGPNRFNQNFGGYYQSTVLNGNRYLIDGASNPLALLEQRSRPERTLRFLGNIEIDYKMFFLPALRAVVNLGLDASQSRIKEFFQDNSTATYQFNFPNTNTNPATNFLFNPGLNYEENQTTTNKTLDAYLMYSRNLNGFVTKFDIQGGYSYQNFKVDGNKEIYRYNGVSSSGSIIESGIRELNIDSTNPNNRYFKPKNNQAFFARSNFDLVNKYLFTLTFRADASSLFKANKRWGYFPAVGFAWKLKEETFLKNLAIVKDLKLRIGWGKTGQENITGSAGYFPSRPLFQIGNANSQYLVGTNSFTALAFNEDITWEKTTTTNFGLDFEFFKKGIISGSLDIFSRKTKDLLAVVASSPGQNLTDQFIKNIGSTSSKGFEANIVVKLAQSENFNLSLNANVGYNIAKVEDLGGITSVTATESGLPGIGINLARHAVGKQPYSALVYAQLYDSNGNAIIGAYADLNKNGTIDEGDKYYKALRPNWTFGFGLNMDYKNFDLTASFRGQYGGQVYNSRLLTTGFIERATQSTTSALNNVLNFNDGTANPLIRNFNANALGDPIFSDYMLQDASFIRCENITLGFKFNKFYKKSSLRVFSGVNNAFIVTKYTGQDPENFNGIDNNFYPRSRVFSLGVNLDF